MSLCQGEKQRFPILFGTDHILHSDQKPESKDDQDRKQPNISKEYFRHQTINLSANLNNSPRRPNPPEKEATIRRIWHVVLIIK